MTRARMRTALAIQTAALRLTDERGGMDGFTMEELAEEVGVSRRTLFNYFPSKLDAICGVKPSVPPELLDRFRQGLPTGDLMSDLEVLLGDLVEHLADMVGVEEIDMDSPEIRCARRVSRDNPAILQNNEQRLRELVQTLGDVALERPGPSLAPEHVRMAVRVLATVCEAALEDFVANDSGAFADHVRGAMQAVRELYIHP